MFASTRFVRRDPRETQHGPQMSGITAGGADAVPGPKMVSKPRAIWQRPHQQFVSDPLRLPFPAANEDPPVSVRILRAAVFPAAGLRHDADQGLENLSRQFHESNCITTYHCY